jgi:hypothetical protein
MLAQYRCIRALARALAGVLCAATALAGCSAGPDAGSSGAKSSGDGSSGSCGLGPLAVPRCDGALWGITTERPNAQDLADAEKAAGRRFDMVYRFHDLSDEIPTQQERELVAAGRVLHVSIDAREFGGAQVRWADVASGRHDDQLRRQARGIASLKAPVFVTFEHEADAPTKLAQGSGEDFAAAWRHVREVFTGAGATNAVWVWVVMGTQPSLGRAGELWPGNDVVDWISWDVYNASGCRAGRIDVGRFTSFEQAAHVFYDWLHATGRSQGIDPTKPLMISETGSVVYPDDPGRTASWYSAIPAALRAMPGVRAVGLWDHAGNAACDYRFNDVPAVQRAITKIGRQPRLDSLSATP